MTDPNKGPTGMVETHEARFHRELRQSTPISKKHEGYVMGAFRKSREGATDVVHQAVEDRIKGLSHTITNKTPQAALRMADYLQEQAERLAEAAAFLRGNALQLDSRPEMNVEGGIVLQQSYDNDAKVGTFTLRGEMTITTTHGEGG